MKKLQILFVVAIATLFTVGNVYADNVSIDLSGAVNGAELECKSLKNYTLNCEGISAFQNSNIDLTNETAIFSGLEEVKNYTIIQNPNAPVKTHKKTDEFLAEDVDITWLQDGNLTSFGNSGGNAWILSMLFTKEDLKSFKGIYNIKRINNIQFELSGDQNSQIVGISIVILSGKFPNLKVERDQVIPPSQSLVAGWNTIPLDEPFMITEGIDSLYIGYVIAFNNGYPVRGTTPLIEKQNRLFVLNSNGQITNDAPQQVSFNIKAGATADVSNTQNNAHFSNLNFVPYVAPNGNLKFELEVANWGNNNITSMDITCKLGSEDPIPLSATGLSVAPGQSIKLNTNDIPIPSSHTAGNTYPVVMTITKVNGVDDGDPSDNTQTSSYTIVSKLVQRIVLHEGFTSSTCGPCKAGNENVKNVQNANSGKYATIKYQVHFPGTGDPYTTTDGVNRIVYYQGSSLSVPFLAVNGGHIYAGNSASYTSTHLNNGYQLPAFANFSNVEAYIDADKKVSFSVEVEPLVTTNQNTQFFAAIIERRTTQNVKTNGETEFENVFKKFLTPSSGYIYGVAQAGSTKKIDLEWTFNGNYRLPIDGQTANRINDNTEHSVENFDNLAVVYWLQDYNTKIVYQAGITDVPLSIKNEYELINSIFPNPVKDILTIDLKEDATVTIWSVEGHKLYEGKQFEGISTIKLNAAPGSYILRTENKNGSHTTKFVIE